jgi:hypothetical protein
MSTIPLISIVAWREISPEFWRGSMDSVRLASSVVDVGGSLRSIVYVDSGAGESGPALMLDRRAPSTLISNSV